MLGIEPVLPNILIFGIISQFFMLGRTMLGVELGSPRNVLQPFVTSVWPPDNSFVLG